MTYKAQIRPLTTGVDALVGTDGNDTFQGIVGASGTLNTFDSINGKGGVNTLNLVVNQATLPSETSIQNIQTVNLLKGTANLTTINASTAFGAELKNLWQVGAAGAVTDLKADQTAGFKGTAANTGSAPIKVSATDTATSLNVALDGAGKGEAAEVALSLAGKKVTTLDISGTIGTEGGKLSLIDLPGKLETVNLAMDSDTNLAAYEGATSSAVTVLASVVTIDGSASAGNLDVGLAGVSELKLETLKTGSGADFVRVDANSFTADDVAIDLGAGNDKIVVTLSEEATADFSITGGAGKDSFVFSGGNLTGTTADDVEINGLVTIEDFSNGSNTLQLADFKGFTAQGLVDTAVEAEGVETLEDAIAAVANVVKDGYATDGFKEGYAAFAQFEFDGATYVYGDVAPESDAQGLSAGDMLIKLVGDVSLNANNVVEFVAEA